MKKIALICILIVCVKLFPQSQINDPWANVVMYNGGTGLLCRIYVSGAVAFTSDLLMVSFGNEIRAKTNLQLIQSMPGEVGRNFLIQNENDSEIFNFFLWRRSENRIYTTLFTLQAQRGYTYGSETNYIRIDFNTSLPSIYGAVTLEGTNTGIAGVQITVPSSTPAYNSSLYTTLVTNATGNYVVPGIAMYTNITIVPYEPRFTFTPVEHNSPSLTQPYQRDFIASPRPQFTVSGFIHTPGGSPIPGVFTYLDPFTSEAFYTNDSGVYSFPLVQGSSIGIFPSKPGYTFDPAFIDIPVIHQHEPNKDFEGTPQTFTIYGTTTQPFTTVNYTSSQGIPGNTISDDTAYYEIISVVYGDTLTITPEKVGFTFTPPATTINNITQDRVANFNATVTNYTVTGNITHNGSNLQGVAIRIGADTITTTNTNGNYSFTRPHGAEFIFYPEKDAFAFTPISVEITELVANEVHNFTAIAIPQHQVTITVTVPPTLSPLAGVTVTHAITGGATGSGITDSNGVVTFTLNETNSNILFTPSHPAYIFTPPFHSQPGLTNVADIGFSATLKTFTVTGNAGAPGVLITITGGPPNVNSGSNGIFTIPNIDYGTSIVITPSLEGYTFEPTTYAVNDITENINLGDIFTANIIKYTITVTCIGYDTLPIIGVNVNVTGATTIPATIPSTNSNGVTTFQVNWGANITVTVQKSGCAFINPTQSITNIIANAGLSFNTRSPLPYTLSGTVTLAEDSSPLPGVTITAGTHSGVTNATGLYSFTVYEAEEFLITPSLTGFQFYPAPIPINYVSGDIEDKDFQASIAMYDLGGIVMYNGEPLSGVTITLRSGVTPTFTDTTSVVTTANGLFNFTQAHGTYVNMVPEYTGFAFTPTSFPTAQLLAPNTNIIFEAIPQPCLISGYVGLEHASQADDPGYAIQGVTIIDTISSLWAETDEFGLYSLWVHYGDNVNLVAQKDNYIFSPSSILITDIQTDTPGQRFMATAVCEAVSFSPPSGIYYEPITVILTTSPSDASIYYTTDGSTPIPSPTSGSTLYTAPFTIPSHTSYIVKAIAVKDTFAPSAITQQNYDVTGNAYKPAIDLESGVFYEAIQVTITPPTGLPTLPPGSEPFRIYYTTNGQTPSHTDATYEIPIYINKNTVLQAAVMRPNYLVAPDSIATAYYQINHLMDLNFTDTIYLNQNTNITVNIANYLTDSVEGEHIYTVSITQPPNHLNLTIFNNTYINIAPHFDWYGTDNLTVKIEFIPTPLPVVIGDLNRPNINFANDMLSVTVNPPSSDIDETNSVDSTSTLSNYPNPFNPETNILFTLTEDAHTTIGVYNVKGQLVEQLANGRFAKGTHRIVWDAKNQASGIYFVLLQCEGGSVMHKMLLMK